MKVIEMMEQVLRSARLVDLTWPLVEGMPTWPTQPKFEAKVFESVEKGDESYWRGITFCEHTGTHIDAPAHFVAGGTTIDKVPLTQAMGRALKIDATDTPPRGTVSLEKIKAFEAANTPIQAGDIVIFHTGWDARFGDPADYMKDWPGLSAEGAEYLKSKQVKAVGCDTLALDADGSPNPAHHILLESGICIIENIHRLGEMPPEFYIIGLPNKFADGSGSPLRLIALLDA